MKKKTIGIVEQELSKAHFGEVFTEKDGRLYANGQAVDDGPTRDEVDRAAALVVDFMVHNNVTTIHVPGYPGIASEIVLSISKVNWS